MEAPDERFESAGMLRAIVLRIVGQGGRFPVERQKDKDMSGIPGWENLQQTIKKSVMRPSLCLEVHTTRGVPDLYEITLSTPWKMLLEEIPCLLHTRPISRYIIVYDDRTFHRFGLRKNEQAFIAGPRLQTLFPPTLLFIPTKKSLHKFTTGVPRLVTI